MLLKLFLLINFLVLIQPKSCEDFFIVRNPFHPSVSRRDSLDDDKRFELIRENYSRVVSSALRHNVAINSDCGGTFRDNQHLIQSPGYPNNYGHNMECVYTLMAPFVCRNYFHVQFIDFDVEPSRNCTKDYVRIGEEDVLCGQVIGIKKYETKAGVLKIKLVTDGWESRKGFQLLITRLPCIDGVENEDSSEQSSTIYPIYKGEPDIGINTVATPSSTNVSPAILPPFTSNRQDIPPPDWNNGYLPPQPMTPIEPNFPQPCGHNNHNPLYPVPPIGIIPNCPNNHNNFPHTQCCPSCNPLLPPSYPHYPEYIPNTPQIPPIGYPGINENPLYPVPPIGIIPNYPNNHNNFPNTPSVPPAYYPPPNLKPWSPISKLNITKQLPQIAPYPSFGYPSLPNPFLGGFQQCCRNYFTNRRFLLVSPNFPAPNRRPTDCLYVIDRASPNTCRLRIEFKFYNHGNEFQCLNDFLEIDGQRVCGCKSGLVYTSQWGYGPKVIRYRNTGYQPNGLSGFILDVIQESCPYRYETPPGIPLKRSDNEPTFIVKRASQIGKATVVRTNSSSVSTIYHFADPDDREVQSQRQQIGVVDEKIPVKKDVPNDLETSATINKDVETAKFFFLNPGVNNGQFRCNLNPVEWLLLKKSALFIQRPICF